MRRALYFTPLLIFALAGCANQQGMKGDMNSAAHTQHMEHMKTMKESMARIRQSTDPAERQKLMEEHMKMMDEHMAGMQNMSCGKM
jgi:Flp pilus assembly protein TadB